MTTPSKTAPFEGPFPRKRHSHTCQTCKGRQGQRAVACYKQKCTKPQSVKDCIFCRALAKHTPVCAPAPPETKSLDDDGGRTQLGNTPTCEDCGESLDDCECGDDPDDDGRREQKKAAAALPEPPAPLQPEVQTLFGPAFREAVRRKPVAAVEPAAQLSLFGG